MQNLSQIYDVDLKLLRCFCTIVEEGSFTAAQATLNLSQSMLSEYLKSLEIRLGTRLCQRGPKGFKLFREGELVYEAAKDLFASVEAFRQRASNLTEKAERELVIGIQDNIVDNPRSRVAEAIGRFEEYYPNVRFRVEVMLGFQLTGRLADGLVHVGVGIVNDHFQQLSAEYLFDEQAWICCAPEHPLFGVPDAEITPEQIASAAYAHRGNHEFYHPDRVRNEAGRGDIGHGAQAHLVLILSGRNIGYVPDHVAQAYFATGQLRPLRPDITRLVNPISAITGPSTADFKLARRFVDCLVDLHMEAAEAAPAKLPPPVRRSERAPAYAAKPRSEPAVIEKNRVAQPC
ncbi:LysR family transcriptional regulator [Methylobrevis albus]|uniref:LysR family transcriptional regulator n=1 Tax=Methylobrevis albus TaxID=2793297 RepID=A0A931MWW3_9HYPH|nr:LysR family transcriptional regulator [Methylobrevis albus]MBH0237983.1 LysR family transcriptional regulator [Methylobrevis albus]